jgi:hypothetical protein
LPYYLFIQNTKKICCNVHSADLKYKNNQSSTQTKKTIIMNNEEQLTLFPEMEKHAQETTGHKYQIRSICDPNFAFSFNVKESEDPEIVALEQMGYFILPETTFA